ncbi:MAG: GGDEF domain-containing protein, partial [Proteobacteria bacterium]|nr:GGDEF domain-containing protein [Pseudomonadota bacterium]
VAGKGGRLAPICLTEDHGLPNTECNGGSQSSGFIDDQGQLAVPTMGGVAVVDTPSIVDQWQHPPTVLLQKMVTNHRVVALPAGAVNLCSHERHPEIVYSAIAFHSAEQISFRYRLDEGAWHLVTERRVLLQNLWVGQHLFEVQARVGGGSWSKGAQQKLVVVPTLFETVWFKALALLGIFSFSLGLIAYVLLRDASTRKHFAENTAELAEANRRLQTLANVDTLTKVYSRRYFEEALALHWASSTRSRQPISLLFVDLDKFKGMNDRYGHPGGDACLVAVATWMTMALRRKADLVSRLGGDEFAVLLPNTDKAGAVRVAEKILNSIRSETIDLVKDKAVLTVSI